MASAFKSAVTANIGTAPVSIYSAPGATTTTIIGLSIANTTGVAVTANVTVTKGGTTVYVIKTAPVPTGSSLVVIGGDQKVVLETGNSIAVTSSAATSLDTVISVLELT